MGGDGGGVHGTANVYLDPPAGAGGAGSASTSWAFPDGADGDHGRYRAYAWGRDALIDASAYPPGSDDGSAVGSEGSCLAA